MLFGSFGFAPMSRVEGGGGIPAPEVTSVDPATGDVAGDEPITVTGTGFVDGATVDVGASPATSVVWVSDTELTCNTPAGSAGAADVTVTNPDLQSDTLEDAFTYEEAPWAPTDFSDPTLAWWRSDLGQTVADDLASVLADQSGQGDADNRDQTQPTEGNRPGYVADDAAYNNKAVLTGNGSQFMATATWSAPAKVPIRLVMVGELSTVTTSLISTDDPGESDMLWNSGGSAQLYSLTGALTADEVGTPAINVPCAIMFTDDGSGEADAAKLFINDFTIPAKTGTTLWNVANSLNLLVGVAGVGKCIGKFAEGIVVGGKSMQDAPDLTFEAAGGTVTRSGGSWLDDGFAVGRVVVIHGTTSNNVRKEITVLTDTVMTLADLTDEGPVSDCTVTSMTDEDVPDLVAYLNGRYELGIT